MKTKWLNFFILWGLLVVVQGFALTILDFASNSVTMLVTAMGTGLTLVLGLRVERQRVRREVEREEADRKMAGLERLREAIFSEKIFQVPEHTEFTPKPESFFLHPSGMFDYGSVLPKTSNVIPFPRQPSADEEETPVEDTVTPKDNKTLVEDMLARNWEAVTPSEKKTLVEDMVARNWAAIKAEEKEFLESEPVICKHCYRQIKGAAHAEGMNRGKMRCDPDDSQLMYGYNAEPSGADCGPTCLGYPE